MGTAHFMEDGFQQYIAANTLLKEKSIF